MVGSVAGMADPISELRPFAADITFLSHNCTASGLTDFKTGEL
jgi:hypothetical protein